MTKRLAMERGRTMTRRDFIKTAGALAAGLALGNSVAYSEEVMNRKKPNILWICTDQQRYDTIAALGNPYICTPNLDKLVSEGVAFTHAFAQNPVCTPSRASFLTGRYPRTTGARQNGQAIPSHEVLITKMLADSGYDCGSQVSFTLPLAINKWKSELTMAIGFLIGVMIPIRIGERIINTQPGLNPKAINGRIYIAHRRASTLLQVCQLSCTRPSGVLIEQLSSFPKNARALG